MKVRHADQAKLFDLSQSLPNGLVYKSGFLTLDEEEILLAYIENLSMPHLQFNDHESKRRGISYEYDFPTFLLPLQNKIAKWLSVPRAMVNEAFIQEYPEGYGIGWHRDRETPLVVGVSLKGWARMRFRPLSNPAEKASPTLHTNLRFGALSQPPRSRSEIVSFEVEPRSAYLMQGEVATRWQHSVAPVPAMRYSITFRTL